LDLVEVLPPGLYEMILEKKKAEDVAPIYSSPA
jgi:hypothetical protein